MTPMIVDPVTGEVLADEATGRLVETIARAVLELDEDEAALTREHEEHLQRIAVDRARLLDELKGLLPAAGVCRVPTPGGVITAGWVPGPKPRASVNRQALDALARDKGLPGALMPREVPQPARLTYPSVACVRKWGPELDRAGIQAADLIVDPPAVPLLVVELEVVRE